MTQDVVAAAILADGRVLAGRRRRDGKWEFPGGKVEPAESPAEALVRELREELAVDVAAGAVIGMAERDGLRLLLLAAEIVGGEPVPLSDHDRLRWADAGELADLDWLPLDRALLGAVRFLLDGDSSGTPLAR